MKSYRIVFAAVLPLLVACFPYVWDEQSLIAFKKSRRAP